MIHQLDDLLPIHLTQRAAEHGEVLAVHAHRPAVHRAEAGHHAVPVRAVGRHPEVGGAVPGQPVEFGEGAGVEQPVDPLPRGHLALGMLAFHGARRSGVNGLVPVLQQHGDLARGGVWVRLARHLAAHAPQGSRRADHVRFSTRRERAQTSEIRTGPVPAAGRRGWRRYRWAQGA